jgi:hypothetical protein
MGSSYFSRCRTNERFTSTKRYPLAGGGDKWLVYDWDQRRSIDVHVLKEVEEGFVFKAVEKFIDNLPANVVKVEISKEGALLSSSSDPLDDRSWVPFYPPRTDFPRHVATVRRSDLTEVDRLGLQVDLTTYRPRLGETRQVVFKYYFTENDVTNWWHEANCVMRMPRHPSIVPFDALVVDTVGGVDRVVGFTTRYIPGGTLSENMDRVFKLRYLEQIINVGALSLVFLTALYTNYWALSNRLSITSTSTWVSFTATYARGTFLLTLRQIVFNSSTSIVGQN